MGEDPLSPSLAFVGASGNSVLEKQAGEDPLRIHAGELTIKDKLPNGPPAQIQHS